jgi:hypothetical protein
MLLLIFLINKNLNLKFSILSLNLLIFLIYLILNKEFIKLLNLIIFNFNINIDLINGLLLIHPIFMYITYCYNIYIITLFFKYKKIKLNLIFLYLKNNI